jgi:type IV pilus assembly protein PilO
LFQPGEETPLEFYAEKPIELKMVGSYHQFGAFVSGVASLPRVVIMTMHNIELTPRGEPGGDKKKLVGIGPNSTLELKGTVKTYRYRDEEETAADASAAASAAPGAPPAAASAATASQGGN